MTRWLKRILGWEEAEDDDLASFEARRPAYVPPRSAKQPAPPKPARQKPQSKSGELSLVDDEDTSASGSRPGGFDPYNTGAFNRSDSWERISKHRDR